MDHDFEIDQLRAELEQLREQKADLERIGDQWEEAHEVNVKHIAELRAGLEALVEALREHAPSAIFAHGPLVDPLREALRLLGRGE